LKKGFWNPKNFEWPKTLFSASGWLYKIPAKNEVFCSEKVLENPKNFLQEVFWRGSGRRPEIP